ncbi:MAG: nitrile hydratase accessory protein [Steroidobacteraceae bacterium]
MSDPPANPKALDAEPGFAEPWQAQAFACAIQLSRRGLFGWPEWVRAFSAEIAAAPARPDETAESAYYRQWLDTLVKLVGIKGAVAPAELDERAELWRRAHLHTPHGQAVELSAAVTMPLSGATPAAHRERAAPAPLAVSAASR